MQRNQLGWLKRRLMGVQCCSSYHKAQKVEDGRRENPGDRQNRGGRLSCKAQRALKRRQSLPGYQRIIAGCLGPNKPVFWR